MIPFTQRLVEKSFRQRLVWVRVFFMLIVGVILLRALYLQVLQRSQFERIASRQGNGSVDVKLRRGPIYDTNGDILAVSLPLDSVFAIPQEVENPSKTAAILAKQLDLPVAQLDKKLRSDISFGWIKRNTKPAVSERLKEMALPGIHFLKEYQRFYPMGRHAAHVIGFSGIDSQGLEGIEYQFNKHLMDNSGVSSVWNYLYTSHQPKTMSGGSLYLTLQSKLQYYTEKELKRAVYAMKADNGVAIVMESTTGEILALANIPDYDPNNFDQFDSSRYFNRAVNASYEPGSTFKIITIASALDSESIPKDSIFYCEEGEYQIQDRVIHDVAKFGWLSLEKIIQKSSNICAAKIGQRIPKSIFYKYIREFGFGTETGIELPGEVSGTVHGYRSWSDTDVATISFGHTISATPIQVITAINTIATGGILIRPRIVKAVFKADGARSFQNKNKGKRIIKQETAEQIKSFMESVLQQGGTGYLARIEGVKIAGKTGTARKYDRRLQAYSTINHISSFIGFFPAEAPQITILVIIDEPKKHYLGSKGAAPIFRKIAEHTLRFYPETLERRHEVALKEPQDYGLFNSAKAPQAEGQISNNIPEIFKGLTLRETLTLANELDLQIDVQGTGRVREIKSKQGKENSYVVILK